MYLKHWEKLEIDLGLVDSFRITSPKRRLYTFSHSNGKSKSRIDRIYLSGDLQGRVMSNVFENCFCSDHKIVRLKLAQSIDRGPGQWIFNNLHLQDDQFIDGIRSIIREYNENPNDLTVADVNEVLFLNGQYFLGPLAYLLLLP